MASKQSGPSSTPKLTKIFSALQTTHQASKSPPLIPTSTVTFKKLQEVLDDYTKKMMLKLRQFTEELMQELKDELLGKLEEILKGFVGIIDDVDDRIEKLETNLESMDKKYQEEMESIDKKHEEEMENLQNNITIMQFREMEFALRIRGLPEDNQEDLKVKVATSLSPVLGCDYGRIFEEIECAYRVNSKIAIQRNLPRDVVIYFSRKARRNEIIWTYYQQRFQIANQDIILLKEVPFKILQKRKEFAFLTQELKNRQIPFRWNIPIGIMVIFDNKRYRLDTLQKAKEFYSLILKAKILSPLQPEVVGGLSKLFEETLSIQGKTQTSQLSEAEEDVNRIMTHAAYRKREAGKKGK